MLIDITADFDFLYNLVFRCHGLGRKCIVNLGRNRVTVFVPRHLLGIAHDDITVDKSSVLADHFRRCRVDDNRVIFHLFRITGCKCLGSGIRRIVKTLRPGHDFGSVYITAGKIFEIQCIRARTVIIHRAIQLPDDIEIVIRVWRFSPPGGLP